MRSKQRVALLYSVLGMAYVLNGLFMLAIPAVWLSFFPLAFSAPASLDALHAVRLLGTVELSLAPLFFWCARNLKRCRSVRLVLTLQSAGFALMVAVSLLAQPQVSTQAWLSLAILAIPALLLLLLGIPPRTVRVKGPRESGEVKWFNANKGFGFITRDNGDDIFVHYRAIRGEGHRTLREGQRVDFFLKRGDKGLQADDVQAL